MLSPPAFVRVTVDGARLSDWDAFHTVFAETFGFPSFYGRNMNAWIDCMSSLDSPEERMSSIHAPEGGIVLLEVLHVEEFAHAQRELYDALVGASAFVNYRKVQVGEPPVLALAFSQYARI
jgi:Barstar (barnase inhibitor)